VLVAADELASVARIEQCARDHGDGRTARDGVALRQVHRRELHPSRLGRARSGVRILGSGVRIPFGWWAERVRGGEIAL
jgi:hypothetical protein